MIFVFLFLTYFTLFNVLGSSTSLELSQMHSFLWLSNIVYMYHNPRIHSSMDGHLGCLHVLAIVNSATVNIGVHVSFSMMKLYLRVYMQKWDCWVIW